VVVAADRGDVVVRGVGDDVVDVPATLDRAGLPVGIRVQRTPGKKDLRLRALPGYPSQPRRLVGINTTEDAGVDHDKQHWPGVNGAVRPWLAGLLRVCVAQPPHLGELLDTRPRRPPPQQSAQGPAPP
jgi:hypothetical protein